MLDKTKILFNRAWGDVWIGNGWRVQDHPVKPGCRVVGPKGVPEFLGSREDCLDHAKNQAPPWAGSHCVVLLHALAGHPDWMSSLARALSRDHQTVRVAYPTNFENLDASERRVRGILSGMADGGIRTVTLIGHSYGGLVIRSLQRQPLPVAIDRAIMLGTPNQGSHLAAILIRTPAYNMFYGPAGRDVLPARVRALPGTNVPTLTIAGGWSERMPFPVLGNNDGVVSIRETQLAGNNVKCATVPAWHRLLPRNPAALRAVASFLKEAP